MAKLALVAMIRETECIGCTKCIEACPADAILGSAKWMHTVIAEECIGCKLCVAPCPVDCIEMIPLIEQEKNKSTRQQKAAHFRNRYHARLARLQARSEQSQLTMQKSVKQDAIQAALERIKKTS